MPAKRVPSTRALDRVVQDITNDHAAVADPHTHMPGGVQTIFGGKGITNSTTRVIRTLPTLQVIVPKLPPTLAMFEG